MAVSEEFKESLKGLSKKTIRCLLIIATEFNGKPFTWTQIRTKYLEKYGDVLSREEDEEDLLDGELITN